MTQHIERLTRLHIDGDPTAYAHLAREQTRRGMWWCGGYELRRWTWDDVLEWATRAFFRVGLYPRLERTVDRRSFVAYLMTHTALPREVGTITIDCDGQPNVWVRWREDVDLYSIHRTHTMHAQTLDEISYGPCAPCARVNGYSWPYGPKGERPLCAPSPLPNPASSSSPPPPSTPSARP